MKRNETISRNLLILDTFHLISAPLQSTNIYIHRKYSKKIFKKYKFSEIDVLYFANFLKSQISFLKKKIT